MLGKSYGFKMRSLLGTELIHMISEPHSVADIESEREKLLSLTFNEVLKLATKLGSGGSTNLQ